MKSNLSIILSGLVILWSIITFFSCSSSSENTYWDWCGTGAGYPLPMKVEISSVQYMKETDSLVVTGTVLDSTSNYPLIGSRVMIFIDNDKTEVSETQTNIDGYFKLATRYSPSYIIEFSYIAYTKRAYTLKDFIKQYFDLDTDH